MRVGVALHACMHCRVNAERTDAARLARQGLVGTAAAHCEHAERDPTRTPTTQRTVSAPRADTDARVARVTGVRLHVEASGDPMAVLNCPDVQSARGGRTSQRACVNACIRWGGRTSRNKRTGACRGAEAGLVGSGGADCRTCGGVERPGRHQERSCKHSVRASARRTEAGRQGRRAGRDAVGARVARCPGGKNASRSSMQ